MSQYTLKNTCMIVMILLACIALNPTWAGGDNYQANIRINAVPITRKRDAWTASGTGWAESATRKTGASRSGCGKSAVSI